MSLFDRAIGWIVPWLGDRRSLSPDTRIVSWSDARRETSTERRRAKRRADCHALRSASWGPYAGAGALRRAGRRAQ
jgi:hypothetical protein